MNFRQRLIADLEESLIPRFPGSPLPELSLKDTGAPVNPGKYLRIIP
jgi:hypothetical protein